MAHDMTRLLYVRELAAADDNLYRAELQERADPGWLSGNGETIAEVVAQYRRRRDEIVAAAREEGIEL